MKYLEWIKESKTYICPKTGVYKIICVGGGSSGGAKYTNHMCCLSHDGKTTSFGNFISANGGLCVYSSHSFSGSNSEISGQGGYDGINYGSSPFCIMSSSPYSSIGADSAKSFSVNYKHGFGAGGGAKSATIRYYYNTSSPSLQTISLFPEIGYCGKMESTIIDLTEGQSIACTVGKGGSNIFSEDEIKSLCIQGTSWTPENISLSPNANEVITTISDSISSGADGVIIVQYLGSEM